jgi:hypothetical protein
MVLLLTNILRESFPKMVLYIFPSGLFIVFPDCVLSPATPAGFKTVFKGMDGRKTSGRKHHSGFSLI